MDLIFKKLHRELFNNKYVKNNARNLVILVFVLSLALTCVIYNIFDYEFVDFFVLMVPVFLFVFSYALLKDLKSDVGKGLLEIYKSQNNLIYTILFFSLSYYLFTLIFEKITINGVMQQVSSISLYICIFSYVSLKELNLKGEIVDKLNHHILLFIIFTVIFIFLFYKISFWFLILQVLVLSYSIWIMLDVNIIENNNKGNYAGS